MSLRTACSDLPYALGARERLTEPQPPCEHPDAGRTFRNAERTGERSLYMSARYRKVPAVSTIDLDMMIMCPARQCPSRWISVHENARVGGTDKHWWLCQETAFRLGAIPVLEMYNPSLRIIKVTWRPSPAATVESRGWLTECQHHEWLSSLVDAHNDTWHGGV